MFTIPPVARRTPHLVIASFCLLASCASTPTTGGSSAASNPSPPAEWTETADGDRIVVVAHGMACPKCVTNADLQLMKLPGVEKVRIDMQHGILDMTVAAGARPSRAEIAKAIDDAGLTLVSIHGRTADGDGS